MLLTAGLLLQYFNSFFSCKPIFHTLSRKAAATTDCCYWIEAKGRAAPSQLQGRTCAGPWHQEGTLPEVLMKLGAALVIDYFPRHVTFIPISGCGSLWAWLWLCQGGHCQYSRTTWGAGLGDNPQFPNFHLNGALHRLDEGMY